ncbi:uncharacterized protein LOC119113030 [Pollicipes pollicipes]|uniref:uncharacterized protein LOC119113030 n=1 Tax=Pollicipes pollicipes TaxID=41117 RepID=UPI0018855FD6|nr:uncharacterized protein LOC119113030 [Pollicipes pollicipes]
MTNVYSTNYTLRVYTSGCLFYNTISDVWESDGCTVTDSNYRATICTCNHLTSFGSGFFVMPNRAIDFEYVFANARYVLPKISFEDNLSIYLTLIISFFIYLVLMFWARWKDKKDLEKIGATPLPDNNPNHKYLYEILIITGNKTNSECDNREKSQFIANKWFAVEEGDGQPAENRCLSSSTSSNTTSRKNLSDGHLWFSVFMRAAAQAASHVWQRVSACMALLYLSMLVNAMWYGLVPDQPGSSAIAFGPFSFSPEQIGVGVMANLIVFPPSFLIVLLFRKSRPRRLKENRVEKAMTEQRARQRKEGKFPEADEQSAAPKSAPPRAVDLADRDGDDESLAESTVPEKRPERKKPFSLPWWCVYFGWLLTFGSMGASIFFLWAYGITFGNEKTTKWLTSLMISFFSSVLFTQPIKVMLTALLVSAICKKLDNGHDDIDDDEEDPALLNDEEWLYAPRKKKQQRKVEYTPVDPAKIEAAKRERQKEVKMWDIIQEMAAYAFFLWILLVLSYDTCRVPKVMRNITRECHKFGSLLYEEKRDFGLGWDETLATRRPFNLKENKRTRAVSVEFSLFNAQVNLFVGCTIVAELSPDGGIVPFFKFEPVRLLNYHSGFGLFVLICDVTFVGFIIYYTVREAKRARKQKKQYMSDPWNYLELGVIVLGYTAIVFYLYRMFLASKIVDTYKKTRGRGYIKLQYVTYLDEVFGYMIGFLVFFGTLKFIKLLRFNKRMGFLTSTLKQCAGDLWGFIVIFLVIFCSFSFTFFLLFGYAMEDFSNFVISIESSFAMMLGRFHFREIQHANAILGPIMFFIFTISMTCVFINIFLTIIIRSFQAVKLDLMKQSNEYEVIDFLVNRLKMLTGIGQPKLNSVGPLAPTDEDERKQDPSQQFPEKVDQLLNYVNDFYFAGKMDLDNKSWLKKTIASDKNSKERLAEGSAGAATAPAGARRNYVPPEELTEEQEQIADI